MSGQGICELTLRQTLQLYHCSGRFISHLFPILEIFKLSPDFSQSVNVLFADLPPLVENTVFICIPHGLPQLSSPFPLSAYLLMAVRIPRTVTSVRPKISRGNTDCAMVY